MVAERSPRNKKKDHIDIKTASQSGSGSQKQLKDLPIKERKQVIQKNIFEMKTKFTNTIAQVEDAIKDQYKGTLTILQNELLACEDSVEEKDVEIRKLKELLKKNKIVIPTK